MKRKKKRNYINNCQNGLYSHSNLSYTGMSNGFIPTLGRRKGILSNLKASDKIDIYKDDDQTRNIKN